jgi:hypothetical protein
VSRGQVVAGVRRQFVPRSIERFAQGDLDRSDLIQLAHANWQERELKSRE